MLRLYFTQLSVSYLAQVILTLSFTLYVAWLYTHSARRADSTRYLMLGMMGITGFFIGRLLYKSLPLHTIWQAYALILQYLSIVLFVWFMMRFAYHAPYFSPRLKREYKVVMGLVTLLSLTAVYIIFKITLFQTSSASVSYLNFYIASGYFGIFIVLVRRTILLDDVGNGRVWHQKLIHPQTKASKSTRIYAVAPFLGLVAVLSSFLYDGGVLSRPISNSLQTVFALAGISFFALSYLNYAPEDTSIRAKMVGIPLFFVLAILGVLSFWVAPDYEGDYGDYVAKNFPLVDHTIRFSPNADGSYTAVSHPIQFQPIDGNELEFKNGDECRTVGIPFTFPYYDQTHDTICISEDGFVAFESTTYPRAIQYGQQPIIAALLMDMNPDAGGSIWFHPDANGVIITWNEIPNHDTNKTSTIQLTLYPNGEIDISYAQISDEQGYGVDLVEGAWATGIQSGNNFNTPEIIDLDSLLAEIPHEGGEGNSILHSYQLLFRTHLHNRMMPLVTLILVASAAILLGIPYIINVGVVSPVTTLADGMKRVDDGDLDVFVSADYSDEIGRMTVSFNGMVDSIKQSNALKDEFLANTSHELRTPLNGIIGLAESMLAGAAGKLSTVQEQNLDLIVLSGRRLANLVNDLLDFSKLKHEELLLRQRPTDLHAITELVLMISMPTAQKKDLRLFSSVPADLAFARADEDRLQQVLHNLIGNAVKFTKTGEIEVSARVMPDGNFVEMWVRDTGIGIPKSQLDLIFKPFEQADSSIARAYSGTGLGLSISKKIVELHGGELQVESQVGMGTTFRFTLPRCSDEEMEMEMAVRQTAVSTLYPVSIVRDAVDKKYTLDSFSTAHFAANQEVTILVVDDEMVNLQVMVNYLRPQGYHVVTSFGGQDALQQMEDGLLPGLILLDVMMPHMTGYEMCELVREQHSMQKMPIIMLTARNQVGDLVRGFAAGANDYLTKPLSQEELLTRIRSHLQLTQTVRAYGRFVPKEILEFLNRDSIVDVQLGDQTERVMSILFADIRNFTAMSERMSREEIFAFINILLSRLSPIIRHHNGFIDKYIGDSIMAIFPQTADDAIQTAITIQKELLDFNVEYTKSGNGSIKMGVGIHMGSIMLGIIGEAERMEGTVIADAVNISARIEQLTKKYDVGILVSEEIINNLSDSYAYQYRFMDRVKVGGKQGIISVYEIFDADDLRHKKAAVQAVFEHGARSYHDRNFETTVSCMEQVQAVLPDDAITASYLKRAKKLLKKGVPADWDGLARVTGL